MEQVLVSAHVEAVAVTVDEVAGSGHTNSGSCLSYGVVNILILEVG